VNTKRKVVDVNDPDYIPTPVDWLMWNVCACMDDSDTDDAGKLRVLGMLAATFARDALDGETEAVRAVREAFGNAAVKFVNAALKATNERGEA